MKPMKHILVIRLSALGDVAMTIPVIYSVARTYPHITFTVLTQAVASKLFIQAPENVSVVVADVKGRHAGISGLWRLFRELRRLHIDAVVDLHDVLRSKWLRFWFSVSGTKCVVIDKGRAEKRRLTSRTHKRFRPLKSSIVRYEEVFTRLGLTFVPRFTSLYGDEKGATTLFSEIVSDKAENEIWIGVAPFAKHKGKIYPVSQMERVVARLAEKKNCRIFLFGGGDDEVQVFNCWKSRYPNIISMGGKHGFEKELALISHLDVMITMDSANMHLASLVGVRVVSVWGATHPYAGFLGWNQSPSDALGVELSCRPCSVFGNKPCFRGDYACMNQLPPEAIVQRVEQVLTARSSME